MTIHTTRAYPLKFKDRRAAASYKITLNLNLEQLYAN